MYMGMALFLRGRLLSQGLAMMLADISSEQSKVNPRGIIQKCEEQSQTLRDLKHKYERHCHALRGALVEVYTGSTLLEGPCWHLSASLPGCEQRVPVSQQHGCAQPTANRPGRGGGTGVNLISVPLSFGPINSRQACRRGRLSASASDARASYELEIDRVNVKHKLQASHNRKTCNIFHCFAFYAQIYSYFIRIRSFFFCLKARYELEIDHVKLYALYVHKTCNILQLNSYF